MLAVTQFTRMDTSKSGSERINGYVTDTREISVSLDGRGVRCWILFNHHNTNADNSDSKPE